jgi:hypothetical protein
MSFVFDLGWIQIVTVFNPAMQSLFMENAPPMATYKAVNHSATSLRTGPDSSPDRKIAGRTEWTGNRFERSEMPPVFASEEGLVIDDRASLRPAQVVENKLTRMLQETALPVSHLQMRGILRGR